MKILIVDNEKLELDVIALTLKKLGGVNAIYADSPKSAIKQLSKHKDIDVVVTDYFMGPDTGLDVAKAVKLLKLNIPVFLMSGRPSEAMGKKEKEAFEFIFDKIDILDRWKFVINKIKDSINKDNL